MRNIDIPLSKNVLSFTFQQSINTGEVPPDWKHANVVAIFKKGSRSEAANYRPVSLTSVPCKLLKHIIYRSIMIHLNYFDILDILVVCNQKLIDSRFLTIRDLIDSNGALREIREPLRSILSPVDHFLLFSLASALSTLFIAVL